jgi:hypothetical protein
MGAKTSRCAGIRYEPIKKRQTSAKSVQTVVLRERKKFFTCKSSQIPPVPLF